MAMAEPQPSTSTGVSSPFQGNMQSQNIDPAVFDCIVSELVDGKALRSLLKKYNVRISIKNEEEENSSQNDMTFEIEKMKIMEEEIQKLRMECDLEKASRMSLEEENTDLKQKMENYDDITIQLTLARDELAVEKDKNKKEAEERSQRIGQAEQNLRALVEEKLKEDQETFEKKLKEEKEKHEAKLKEEVTKLKAQFEKELAQSLKRIVTLYNEKEAGALRFKLFLEELGGIIEKPVSNGADLLAQSDGLQEFLNQIKTLVVLRNQERTELEKHRENSSFFHGLMMKGMNRFKSSAGGSASTSSTESVVPPEHQPNANSVPEAPSGASGSNTQESSPANQPPATPTPSFSSLPRNPETSFSTPVAGAANRTNPRNFPNTKIKIEAPDESPVPVISSTTSYATPSSISPPLPSPSAMPPTPPPDENISISAIKRAYSPPPVVDDEDDEDDEVDFIHNVEVDEFPPPTDLPQPSIVIPTQGFGAGPSTRSDLMSEAPSNRKRALSPSTPTSSRSNPPPKRRGLGSNKQKTPFAVTDKEHGVSSRRRRCLCGNKYKTKNELEVHIKRMALEWKFKCPHCCYFFFFEIDRRNHLCEPDTLSQPPTPQQETVALPEEPFPPPPQQLEPEQPSAPPPQQQEQPLPAAETPTHEESWEYINEIFSTTPQTSNQAAKNGRKAASSPKRKRPTPKSNNSILMNRRKLQQLFSRNKKHVPWSESTVQGHWMCTCGRKFPSRNRLITHTNYYGRDWKFQCEHCPESFPFMCHLKKHLQSHHQMPDALKEFVVGCPLCGQMFPTRKDFQSHRKSEHPGVPTRRSRKAASAANPPSTEPVASTSTAAASTTNAPEGDSAGNDADDVTIIEVVSPENRNNGNPKSERRGRK